MTTTYLGELNLRDVEFLHDFIPEHVGGGKKPTPSAALLVSPGTGLEINDVVENVLISNLSGTVQQRGTDVISSQHGPGEFRAGV